MSYAVNVFDRYSNGTWISIGNESSSGTVNVSSSESLLFRITVPESFDVLTDFWFRIFASNRNSASIRWALYGSNPGAATGYAPSGAFYSTTAQPETTETPITYVANEFSASGLSYDLSNSRTIYLLIQNFNPSSISINVSGGTGTSRRATVDGRNRAPTLSWSSNTAVTDGSIILSVSNLPGNTPVRVKYGSTNLESYTWAEDKQSVGISFPDSTLKQWFAQAGVATLQSITVTATVDYYPTVTASFTLTAGENMKPMVGTPTVSIVQPARIASTFPNTWIANVSKAKVTVSAAAGSNAAINSVTVSYGAETMSLTYNSTSGLYEGTTAKPVTGNTMFTAIVTDQRGMTARSYYSLSGVNAYSKPTVSIDGANTYRCDSAGDEQDGGPYVQVMVTANVDTGIDGNALNTLLFYVEEDGTRAYALENGVQSDPIALQNPRQDYAITVVVVAQDKISDQVTAKIQLNGAHRDVAIARASGKTSIGIGVSPSAIVDQEGSPADGVNIAGKGVYLVNGIDITHFLTGKKNQMNSSTKAEWNSDLLGVDFTNSKAAMNETVQFLIRPSDGWANVPAALQSATSFSGVRFVIYTSGWVYVVIIENTPVRGRIWVNTHMRSTNQSYSWYGWVGHTPDIT